MRKLLFITALFLAITASPLFVFAENDNNNVGGNTVEIEELNKKIAEKREKVKELEKSIEQYKEKIQKKRNEAVSLNNQLAILDNHIVQVELDIEATNEKLETIELEIESLKLSIDEKEKDIQKQKLILAEFIRTLHYKENKNFIEIITAYDDFSQFFDQLQYLKTIESDITQSHKALTLAKADLEDKKQVSEERKDSYEDLKEKLVNRKQDLDEQIGLKQNLMAQTHASEMTYRTLLENLKQQYSQIENEIVGIEQEVRRKLEEQNKLDESSIEFDGILLWPAPSRYITAYFHDPEYPYRHIFEHNGIDIRAGQGTAVRAAASGYVARAKYCSSSSCYSYIMLIHSGGLSTVYGHLSQIAVSTDQFVTKGDVIGYSGGMPGTIGAGPFVTGPHLHFEVRKNGIPVDPLNYL